MATDLFPDESNENEIPTTIVCPDCGGVASLITHLDDENPHPMGEPVAYRCRDCLDRWDVIWDPDTE